MSTFDNVIQWANDRKIIENSNPNAQFVKLAEEFGELAEGLSKNDPEKVVDSIGDMMVVLTILSEIYARQNYDEDAWQYVLGNTNVEKFFHNAYLTIKDRKGYLSAEGIFIKEE